jgi:50S ribosomal protein L16 3-hydroxylase
MDSDRMLGSLDAATFLERHWQKEPLLVRGALPGIDALLSPGELAGIAGDPDVDSRLVSGGDGEPWRLRSGPFDAAAFAALPERRWTLLVQEVDRLLPRVADLRDRFAFVPNWRLDDVMISYAAPGGSVGPHVDNYDVFLIQAHGRRIWRVERRPLDQERLVPGIDLRVLETFDPDVEWTVEPGDMLYLPPRRAHHGVALEASMTWSIGFRAPALAELLGDFLTHVASGVDPRRRYADPDLRLQEHPGEIAPDVLESVRRLIGEAVDDEVLLRDWLGRFVTEPGRENDLMPPPEPCSPETLVGSLRRGSVLRRTALNCFAFIRSGDRTTLYLGGESHAGHESLAPLVTGREPLTAATLGDRLEDAAVVRLLVGLVNRGLLVLDD